MATLIVPGIEITAGTTTAGIGTLIGVALIFGLVNAVLKPLIKVVGCLFYVLTLGLIGLVVNALLFLLVGWIADGLGLPFERDRVPAGVPRARSWSRWSARCCTSSSRTPRTAAGLRARTPRAQTGQVSRR